MNGAAVAFQRLVFWEPTVSPHKHPLFEAISRLRPDLEIVCVADADLSEDRRRLGWSVPDPVGYRQIVAPLASQIEELVKRPDGQDPAATLHVFAGFRWYRTLVEGLAAVRRAGLPYAIQSEPRASDGWKGVLRRAHSLMTERRLAREARLVLAIGRHGPPWFESIGYPSERVFPFAYFVPPPAIPTGSPFAGSHEARARREASTAIGYLGRLEPTKGVQYLIPAWQRLQHFSKLRIVGAGTSKDSLVAAATAFDAGRVTVEDALPIDRVGEFLSTLDILVLPSISTDDGWGVVVSEAIMCGCAVVVSERVGASIVADIGDNGAVIPAQSSEAITDAIDRLIAGGSLDASARLRRRSWAVAHLSAEAGARSLGEILRFIEGKGPRPRPFFA